MSPGVYAGRRRRWGERGPLPRGARLQLNADAQRRTWNRQPSSQARRRPCDQTAFAIGIARKPRISSPRSRASRPVSATVPPTGGTASGQTHVDRGAGDSGTPRVRSLPRARSSHSGAVSARAREWLAAKRSRRGGEPCSGDVNVRAPRATPRLERLRRSPAPAEVPRELPELRRATPKKAILHRVWTALAVTAVSCGPALPATRSSAGTVEPSGANPPSQLRASSPDRGTSASAVCIGAVRRPRRLQSASGSRDAEETRRLLSPYFDTAVADRAVRRHGGEVHRRCRNAVWGTPTATGTTPSAPCALPSPRRLVSSLGTRSARPTCGLAPGSSPARRRSRSAPRPGHGCGDLVNTACASSRSPSRLRSRGRSTRRSTEHSTPTRTWSVRVEGKSLTPLCAPSACLGVRARSSRPVSSRRSSGATVSCA